MDRSLLPYRKEREPFYAAVGEALQAWSSVEHELERLFVTLLKTNTKLGRIVMASIISFRARVLVCNNLVIALAPSETIRERWINIYNRLLRKYEKRSELAHFAVTSISDADGENERHRLIPYFTFGNLDILSARKQRWPDGLTVEQIQERTDGFVKLLFDLDSFNRDFVADRRKAARDRRQKLDPGRKRAAPSGRTPKGASRPPRSSEG
jgi:hypothetical protein